MRDHILAEIKRVASEAGGAAPGKRTFEAATGIRESDWLGRYWARWGDAVADAGLTPNTLQAALGRETLLEQLAIAVRQVGHAPTKPELRLYARSKPGFPAYNTFSSQLGAKAEVFNALRDWVATEAEFADVAAILGPRPAIPPNQSSKAPRVTAATDGFVYLIRSGAYHKVGRSEDLERRIKSIAVALPDKAVLEHSIRTDDPAGIETYWHRRFVDRRVNGEWFKLTAADVKAFKRRTFQ